MSVNQKIRITLKAYDHRLLDKSAANIREIAASTGAVVGGPVPMPTHIKTFCVLRSPHIDKKSREHFAMTTHKRVLDVFGCSPRTVDALMSLSLSAGVSVEIDY
jgi:small subunit ribosomal protein S10